LIPSCRIATGNIGEGHAVSQRRNISCSSPGSNFSTTVSSWGMKLGARWQFWSNTHFPVFPPSLTPARALGPCPCPRLIGLIFESMSSPSASFWMSFIGSLPVARM